MKQARVTRMAARRGAVECYEDSNNTYTIFERGGRVWIEAYALGGAKRSMPQVNSVEEAREYILHRNDRKGHPISFF
jgi:hypothetical protein